MRICECMFNVYCINYLWLVWVDIREWMEYDYGKTLLIYVYICLHM